MQQNKILFITFSNTVKDVQTLLKTYTDFPITVRGHNEELGRDIEKIIGMDRPKAIIYDGNFSFTTNLEYEHARILTLVSCFDVDCKLYSFEKLLKLPGVSLLTGKQLKAIIPEPN